MNVADIILIIVIALALAGAVIQTVRTKKRGGGCCGDCSRCTGHDTGKCKEKKVR